MLYYDFGHEVEAFSTEIADALDFDVMLPLHQSHATDCVVVTADTKPEETRGADALMTRVPGLRIGVKTADCVPILLYDAQNKVVAAVHSGWRGTKANIVAAVIKKMAEEFGTEAAEVHAVIGPCIHLGAFEVGDELYDTFAAAGYGQWCHRMPRWGEHGYVQWHIDLPGICAAQMRASGVLRVEDAKHCTYAEHERFYSARRLGKNFGKQRILNCIALV